MTGRLTLLRTRPGWDLTALLNAADARAQRPERHLWLVRLLEWVRAPGPLPTPLPADADPEVADPALAAAATPWPVRRLRHLLNVLDRHPERRDQVGALLRRTVEELDATGLLADFGFAPRNAFLGELSERNPGDWIEWDATAGKIANKPELNAQLLRKYRDGWSVEGLG